MTANELRVGNWVNNNEEDYQITSATIGQLERGNSTATPIKLTRKWLLRFGGKKVKGLDWSIKFGGLQFYCRYNKKWYSSIDGLYLSDRIQYVHQLQNLYFAITGFELEVSV